MARGIERALANTIFDAVAKFASYGFNKSHAAAYALLSYQTAWLKAHYPHEFFAASMSLDLSNTDKLAVFYQDAKRFDVPVLAPDINRSSADFDVAWDDDKGAVLYALGAIRNVGLEAMKHVIEVRETGGRFADIFDFLERVDPRSVNKRALEGLAKAGAFDSIHPNRRQLLEQADVLMAYCQSVAAERASSTGGIRPWAAWMWSASTSEARSRVLMVIASHGLRPARSSSISVSKTWANRTRASRPKAPAPPLTEWTARKTALIVSMSVWPCSSSISLASRSASSSSHSWKKVALMASKASMAVGPTDLEKC